MSETPPLSLSPEDVKNNLYSTFCDAVMALSFKGILCGDDGEFLLTTHPDMIDVHRDPRWEALRKQQKGKPGRNGRNGNGR